VHFALPSDDSSPSRLGHTISSAYIVNFQTHLFSVLPATFAGGFKKLLAATLALFTEGATPDIPTSVRDTKLWPSFELLGLADRYESLIASVCYEHIEAHVLEICAGKWGEPMLSKLREWMADKVVPWMLMPYARGAKTSECPLPPPARGYLDLISPVHSPQLRKPGRCCKALDLDLTSTFAKHCVIFGRVVVGRSSPSPDSSSSFLFQSCSTKEMFDIVIDYPDSTPALYDLKVG
jgi:hypothetical protein